MSHLSSDVWQQAQDSVPIVCVDFVPVEPGTGQIGLIRRDSPYGDVWCHLGGRIRRGETIAGALERHAIETLGVSLVGLDPLRPAVAFQWFPPSLVPESSESFGLDSRKHSVSLGYFGILSGNPEPRGEALEFSWFEWAELPAPLWPGCVRFLDLLRRDSSRP